MVYKLRSQIPQFTERFVHQCGAFEYFQNTISGMGKSFILRFEITLYGTALTQMNQDPITFYWSYVASYCNCLIFKGISTWFV